MLLNVDILPSSLAANPVGAVMASLTCADCSTVRVEWLPFHCTNCGKVCGYVTGTVKFLFYICPPCYETYGEIAGTYAVPEAEYNENVMTEMVETYGRPLSTEELAVLEAAGRLSSGLQLLMRESPYS